MKHLDFWRFTVSWSWSKKDMLIGYYTPDRDKNNWYLYISLIYKWRFEIHHERL